MLVLQLMVAKVQHAILSFGYEKIGVGQFAVVCFPRSVRDPLLKELLERKAAP